MTAVEKILLDGLQKDPADWSVRIELATKMAERGAKEAAARILAQAPEAVPSEDLLKTAAGLIGEESPVARGLFESYLLENPSSGFTHVSLARIHAAEGRTDRAKKHYNTAVALDGSLKESLFEARLNPTARHSPEPVPEAKQPTEPVVVLAPKPLKPPPGFGDLPADRGEEETKKPIAVITVLEDDGDDEESVAVVAAGIEDEAENEEKPDSKGAPEAEEGAGTGERVFIVGVGELVHAHEKESDTKAKISALTLALLIHVVLFVLLGFVVISMPRPAPPQLVASSIASTEDHNIEEKVVERVRRNPQTASAQMEVVTVEAASPVSMPQFDVNATTFEALGNTTDFGMSMAFDMSEDGAMVSFFGSKSISKKVIFVVDYSQSMNGDKDKLMRKELTKSLQALPNGVQYALILFAGPAWYAGQEVEKAKMIDNWLGNEVRDGGKNWIWYQGWDEKHRVPAGGESNKSALHHYSEGFEDLPKGEYTAAGRSTIAKTVKHVQETPLLFGTDWRSPLMMAMNLEPDTIYFMTDGALPSPPKGVQKSEVMKDLLQYNSKKSRAKINTICMMVLQAREELEMLAEGSRGEFTLVLEDGTPVRGKDLDKAPTGSGKGKGKGKGKK